MIKRADTLPKRLFIEYFFQEDILHASKIIFSFEPLMERLHYSAVVFCDLTVAY